MKYISGNPARIELTRRNLQTLLDKLDDPNSLRTLQKQEERGTGDAWIIVTAVEDDEHYQSRGYGAGTVYMPTSGEVR